MLESAERRLRLMRKGIVEDTAGVNLPCDSAAAFNVALGFPGKDAAMRVFKRAVACLGRIQES